MRLGLILVAASFISSAASAQVYVHGYTKKDGTYVAPHYRSNPDGNAFNNYSTRGNVNPYTGQAGTKDPYGNNRSNSGSSSYGSYSNPYSSTQPTTSCIYYTPC